MKVAEDALGVIEPHERPCSEVALHFDAEDRRSEDDGAGFEECPEVCECDPLSGIDPGMQ